MTINGAYVAGETAINVLSGALDAVAGTVLLEEETGELMLVTTDPVIDTTLPVLTRTYGAVATTNITNGDHFLVVGNVHAEGSAVPTVKSYAPTPLTNVCQIFRMPLSFTRTAKKTYLRYDSTGPYREAKREALSLHAIEMEKSFIFGENIVGVGTNGKPMRMTAGVISFLTTNIGGAYTVGGLLTEDVLDTLCEGIFRYGSTEKLVLCGSTFVKALTTLGKRNGTLNMVPQDKIYGMKVIEYLSAFGTLYLKMHPLFNQHPTLRQNALVLDVNNLSSRYIDDTMFIKNRQAPGDDQVIDEFLTEAGLELHFEQTHAYITGVTGADVA
jgi:hypothetical protein